MSEQPRELKTKSYSRRAVDNYYKRVRDDPERHKALKEYQKQYYQNRKNELMMLREQIKSLKKVENKN